MMNMLIQFAVMDINDVGGNDCLCENCDLCGDVTPIWIFWTIAALFLAVFIAGLALRIRLARKKENIMKAGILMVIGFIGVVVFALFAINGWPFSIFSD